MINIVTEWFDLNRSTWKGVKNNVEIPHFIHRSREDYFTYFTELCKIRNPITIFTEPHLVSEFKAIGKIHNTNLQVIPYDFFGQFTELRGRIREIMDSPRYISSIVNPSLPEYWNENYILVNYLKTVLVNECYINNLIDKTQPTAWIDFGYVRDGNRFPKENFEWNYDKFNDGKIHIFQIQDIPYTLNLGEIISKSIVYFQGCHAVSNEYGWDKYHKMMYLSLHELLSNDVIDDDQTLMLMSYIKYPNMFVAHRTDPNRDGWFIIFKDFYE